jgi:ribonucleoside-diphosphate reductase alpha chain
LAEQLTQNLVPHVAVRRDLPRIRNAKNFKFTVAGTRGYVIVGEYEDGTPGELFISSSKMGSTLRGVMDAFGIAVSYGLQYGVPLKSYVRVFANTSFAPAGITDDPEIRTASSLIDYIFRRLGKTYLSFDERLEVGLASLEDQPAGQTSLLSDTSVPGTIVEQALETVAEAEAAITEAITTVAASTADLSLQKDTKADIAPIVKDAVRPDDAAPLCYNCGNQTQRAGSCYVCTSCGSTTGCS